MYVFIHHDKVNLRPLAEVLCLCVLYVGMYMYTAKNVGCICILPKMIYTFS